MGLQNARKLPDGRHVPAGAATRVGKRQFGPFRALSQAARRVQDAPRPWHSNSGLLAITRFASANSANSCASFFASPL